MEIKRAQIKVLTEFANTKLYLRKNYSEQSSSGTYTLNLLCAVDVTLTTIPAAACCSFMVTPKKWAHCFSTWRK